jgi:hypothetical protein
VKVPEPDPRYPVGRFSKPEDTSAGRVSGWIAEIEAAPAALRKAVAGLGEDQLDTPYREGGWTVRQVVHHLPDSHLNSWIRIRWALTEDEPSIKTYEEARWAELPDARSGPIEESLALLDALHVRWVRLLRALTPDQLARRYHHPDWGTPSVAMTLAISAWHGRHHVAHITALRERRGW